MSRQVSGSEKSLINAIREGDVPNPQLLDWNNWQVWRRDIGLRPVVARDGFVTSTTTELALWKSVMNDIYGEDWSLQLARGDQPLEAAGEEPEPQGVSQQTREPGLGVAQPLVPAAVAGAPVVLGPLEARQQASEPGLGVAQPLVPAAAAAAPTTPLRRAVEVGDGPGSGDGPEKGPGSGLASPDPSWSNQNPGTPTTLNQNVLKSIQS